MSAFNSLQEHLDKLKQKNVKNYFFTSREVIEIQSRIYYSENPNLGFNTVAMIDKTYSSQIGGFILDIIRINPKKKINILEIGPGNGVFFKRLNTILSQKKVNFTYTMVDVAPDNLKPLLKNFNNLKIIKSTFHNFAITNKKKFDFLIANEALDMWAGGDSIVNQNKQNIIYPLWILHDVYNDIILSKNEVNKLKSSSNQLVWEQIYLIHERNVWKESMLDNSRKIAIIFIPKELINLLQDITYLSIFQDYWSYGDPNPLRIGINNEVLGNLTMYWEKNYPEYAKSILLKDIKDKLGQNSEGKDRIWLETSIIPFGETDVTYSPNQIEFLNAIEKFDYQVTTIPISGGEILILFRKNLLDLHF
ncbi:MAG: hypothetical protein ACXAC7_06350 [Candidatus Hodarchaeales archaeon]